MPTKKSAIEIVLCHKAPLLREGKYVGDIGWGLLYRLSPEEFKVSGMAIVCRSLAEYPTRQVTETSEYDSMSKQEREKFDRSHHDVLVWAKEDGSLALQNRCSSEVMVANGADTQVDEIYSILIKLVEVSGGNTGG